MDAASMEEFAAGILQQARKSAKVQTEFSMWENIQGFYHAVDWSEPWIIGLILFHICMYALVIRFRKSSNFQMASFVFICAIVFCAEPMNTWLQRRWRLFATQNYFDRSGVFMSVMFSCPLLLLVFAQLMMALKRSMELVVKVKRLELAAKRKKDGATAPPSEPATSTPSAGTQEGLRQRAPAAPRE